MVDIRIGLKNNPECGHGKSGRKATNLPPFPKKEDLRRRAQKTYVSFIVSSW